MKIPREIKIQLKLVFLNYSPRAAEYEMMSVIRGFHIYCAVWTPVLGEELESRREVGNVDRYAVGVYKPDGTLVGHLPRRISTLSSVSLNRGGSISCQVTGRRKRSIDLPQGGLEIPCVLKFKGEKKDIKKLRKLTMNHHEN